ncbi:EpsD family peptidyl-prolyl cis-trans isomerase [Aquabacterium sp.]|uniref:EpsD family peptidyl-prolyl cis-trans isomerase n=1 Tax=Aquabacterium sp. TaxID=1872578 RepID=UPI002621DB9A|nr:EpsD family peptidyl-prolyl cis-trans isomerase [Aquabacterium sp.]MDD2976783.1 EpsD family peptidyl-prolyl cis-trans isomerase [Aquabacterium sp.]
MTIRLQATARQRTLRSMALLPVVVAAALAAGCGDKSSSEGKATQAAARVDGSEITVHQINQVLERQQGLKPEQAEAASHQVLESLIDQQLAVAKAEEQKLDRDPQVVQMLEATRRSILARTYLEKAAASGAGAPTAEEIRKYYDEKPALFSQRKVYALQEFTVPVAGEQGRALIEQLKATRGPAQFVEVIKASGVKFTANPITQAAEGLPLGIIEPLSKVSDGEALYITGGDGFKALLVVASRSQPVAFEQAKPAIEQYLTVERRREFALKEMKGLREAAKVEYLGKFVNKPASGVAAATAASDVKPPVAAAASGADSLDPAAISKGISGLK